MKSPGAGDSFAAKLSSNGVLGFNSVIVGQSDRELHFWLEESW